MSKTDIHKLISHCRSVINIWNDYATYYILSNAKCQGRSRILDSYGGRAPMRRPAAIVALVLAIGVAGTAIALAGREGNTQFTAQQQSLLPVSAGALERLLLTTSDPRPGSGGRARGANCTSPTHIALGNPWTCVVRYPRLPRVRYSIIVYADRSIRGSGLPEGAVHGTELSIRGCCVAGS
jgi:hypothetical protein